MGNEDAREQPSPDRLRVRWPIVGTAFSWGWVAHWRGPVATVRLPVGRAEVPGQFVVERRRFAPVAGWQATA